MHSIPKCMHSARCMRLVDESVELSCYTDILTLLLIV
jgi:hypothetical protein